MRHLRLAAIFVFLSAVGLATSASPRAHATTVFDPTNFIQNFMQQLRGVQSNINEAKQLQAQLQQYQNMLRNTQSLNVDDLPSAIDALSRLDRVVREGKSLAVSAGDYEAAFKARFPGFQPGTSFSEGYRQWSATSRDSILGAMRVANLQARSAETEEDALASLRAAVSSADGQKAAVDAGNQIALAQISQLQQLRELMLAQMQATGTYMAASQQTEESRESSIRAASKYRDPREGWKPKPIRIGQ